MSSASSPPNPQPTAHGAAQEPVPTFYNVIHLEEEIERRKMTLIAQSAVRSPPNWDEEVKVIERLEARLHDLKANGYSHRASRPQEAPVRDALAHDNTAMDFVCDLLARMAVERRRR